MRSARTDNPINAASQAALISPAQGSRRTTRRLTAISNASVGTHNNANNRRVRRVFPVRDILRTFAHSSGPRVPAFAGTNQKPIFFQNQSLFELSFRLFSLFTFTAISGLPLVQLVHLLAQGSKRTRRKDSLHGQSKVSGDPEGQFQGRSVVPALQKPDGLGIHPDGRCERCPRDLFFRPKHCDAVMKRHDAFIHHIVAYTQYPNLETRDRATVTSVGLVP